MNIKLRGGLLSCTLLLLTGCQPQLQENKLNNGVAISENDFSQLDRTLVQRPLNYQECLLKNGSGAVSTLHEDKDWHTCKDGEVSYTYSSRAKNPDLLPTRYDEYNQYHPDEQIQSTITFVFENINLPITEQNSLIELFALTGDAIKHKTPKINRANPKLQRTLPRGKPTLTITGEFKKDFSVKRTKNWLHIQKTSERLHEPKLFMQTLAGEDIELGSLRHPDAIYIRNYEEELGEIPLLSTTTQINNYLKKHLEQPQTLNIVSYGQEAIYNENENYFGPKTDHYLKIQIENLTYQDYGLKPELCFDTICFDNEKPIKNHKNRYFQKLFTDPAREEEILLLYNQALKLIIKIEHLFMESRFSRNQESNEYEIEQEKDYSCMDNSLKQKLHLKTALTLPEQITLFWENYELQNLNFDENNEQEHEKYGERQSFRELFTNQEELESKISNHIKTTWILHKSYLVKFKSHPNLTLIYSRTNTDPLPEAVFHSKKPFTTDQEGHLNDLTRSKEIYCSMKQRGVFLESTCPETTDFRTKALHDSLWLDDSKSQNADLSTEGYPYSNDSIIFNEKVLPIYKIKASPIPEYYYIYAASGVQFEYGGGGCKPVVYTYDHLQRDNELTITLPKQSSFTKLIPNFTKDTTRSFSTDQNSNIQVEGKLFPYLYYSTYRGNYQNNHYGRTVKGSDIKHFLEHKLTAMNLNQKEKSDFLEYWLPEFKPEFVYSISFKFNEAFEPYAKFQRKHTPEKSFRVFMEAHEHPKTMHASYNPRYPDAGNTLFLKRFERGSNFDMLEWWGNLVKLQ